MAITGTTRIFAVLGDPVAPLRSPALFNAAFARLGRDAVFIPLQVAAGALPVVWPALRAMDNLEGIVITMPHKEAVLPLLDGLGSTARLTGTVNTVRRRPGGGFEGDMFDGEGFRDGLERAGQAPTGSSVLQIGAGAAGRAIAYALARAGVGRLTLFDAVPGRAATMVTALTREFPQIDAVEGEPVTVGHDIIVNATPLGLREGDPLPIATDALRPSQVVADVIPNPEMTPLLVAARERGCAVVTGRSMHEGQARLAAAYLGIEGWDD